MIDDSHVFRGRRIGTARLDNTGKIIGQRDGARFRQASLIRCVRGAADEGGQVLRPGAELLDVRLRHTQHHRDDCCRQVLGEGIDEVDLFAACAPFDQLVNHTFDDHFNLRAEID